MKRLLLGAATCFAVAIGATVGSSAQSASAQKVSASAQSSQTASARQAAAAPAQATPAVPAAEVVTANKALVQKYCVSCHNEKLKSGGLALSTLDMAQVAKNADSWEHV